MRRCLQRRTATGFIFFALLPALACTKKSIAIEVGVPEKTTPSVASKSAATSPTPSRDSKTPTPTPTIGATPAIEAPTPTPTIGTTPAVETPTTTPTIAATPDIEAPTTQTWSLDTVTLTTNASAPFSVGSVFSCSATLEQAGVPPAGLVTYRFFNGSNGTIGTNSLFTATVGEANDSIGCEATLNPSADTSATIVSTTIAAVERYFIGFPLSLTGGSTTGAGCSVTQPISSTVLPSYTASAPTLTKTSPSAFVAAGANAFGFSFTVDPTGLSGGETIDFTYARSVTAMLAALLPQSVLESKIYRLLITKDASDAGWVPTIPTLWSTDTLQGRGLQPVQGSGCYVDASSRAEISTGGNTMCMKSNSGYKCWGNAANERFAGHASADQPLPLAITSIGTGLTAPVQLSVGDKSSCAVRKDGSVACWGSRDFGALGDGFDDSSPQPTPQVLTLPGMEKAVHVEISAITGIEQRACAILESGKLACWGHNGNGILEPAPTVPMSPANKLTPELLGTFGSSLNDKVTSVALGSAHICTTDSSGRVHCWGGNNKLQAGQAAGGPVVSAVTQVGVFGATSANKAVMVVAGRSFSCALTQDGKVWCWGLNEDGDGDQNGESGMLGMGDTMLLTSAVPLQAGAAMLGDTSAHRVQTITASTQGVCALRLDGTVWCWGEGYGHFGVGNNANQFSPVQFNSAVVGASPEKRAVAVAVGYQTTCVVLLDRTVLCSGDDVSGILGNGAGAGTYGGDSYVRIDSGVDTPRTDAQSATSAVLTLTQQ